MKKNNPKYIYRNEKRFSLFVLALLSVFSASAQKLIDKTAQIVFDSKTPLEAIHGTTNTALSILDESSGDIQFAVLAKSFNFDRALMQEHFNENYIESDKYPKATFKGIIKNISDVNFKADGTYPVTIDGDLTMHGVTNHVTVKGTIKITGGKISGASAFSVVPQDYKIEIPKLVEDKIAKQINISVSVNYQPYQN